MDWSKKLSNTVKSANELLYNVSKTLPNRQNADIPIDYDLSKLKRKDEICILQGSNIDKAKADILDLNLYLKEAPNRHPCFPLKQITTSDLCFKEKLINGFNQYCFLSFSPLTKTGKTPKYPMVLHFNLSPELFGQIYYGQDNEIGKVIIIAWNNQICYELNLSMINGVLDINSIYKTNPVTYKKQKMYYQ